MKRLKHFLLACDSKTETYRSMYEGRLIIPAQTPGNPSEFAETEYEPTYWANCAGAEIAFTIGQPNKYTLDRPSVTIAIPAHLLGDEAAALAPDSTEAVMAADFALRAFSAEIDPLNEALFNRSRPDRENGRYFLRRPGGDVLVRNAACFAIRPPKGYDNGSGAIVHLRADAAQQPCLCLCILLEVQLPAGKLKRTIQMLCRDLPDAVESFIMRFDTTALSHTLALSRTQTAIRAAMPEAGLCAFIANGSVLPRAQDGGPMAGAIPFTAPPADEITLCGVRGMGIPRGVNVITGGGYSGKSTLLDAIAAGIYNHAAGDGRELCLTDNSAVSIAAEDGRQVSRVNISPFIGWIPGGDPADFSTAHASGSTSQAANIVEAIGDGARLLLIDEDRSATNFMIRDGMMKALIRREPITPFTDRVRELAARGVSTILVIGGSGAYLSVADRIWRMEDFRIANVTAEARQVSAAMDGCPPAPLPPAEWALPKPLAQEGFTSYPERSSKEKMQVFDLGFVYLGDEKLDLRGLGNLICPEQLAGLAFLLRQMMVTLNRPVFDAGETLAALYAKIAREGLDCIWSNVFPDSPRFLDLPRPAEVLAALHRMRKVTKL